MSVKHRLSTVTHKADTTLKDRSVVPWSHSLCLSPLPRFQHCCLCTSCRDACERISAIQAVLKRQNCCHLKRKKHVNLACSSCLKHANEMLLGDSRQADQRTQNFNFSIVIHQFLDPAPSSLSLHACMNQSSTVRFQLALIIEQRAHSST